MLGDVLEMMPSLVEEYGAADLLFIDGKPSEYRQYLEAAESSGLVRPGTWGKSVCGAAQRDWLDRVNGCKCYWLAQACMFV